jgi:AraC-like DNA-binding protein
MESLSRTTRAADAMLHGEREWAHFSACPAIFGIECIHASFITHTFPWHVHDYYAIGVIETGTQTFSCRSGKHRTPTGGIFAVHPDEPHTGEPATAAGFTYRTFYPSAALLQCAAEEHSGRRQPAPFFPAPVIVDGTLARQLLALHRALTGPISAVEGETRVLETFVAMIARHADGRGAARPFGWEHAAVRRIRDYIEAHYNQDISLTRLAALVSLSPYYVARVFRAEVGLPPHGYLESVRIRRAQSLLADGMPPAAVACATGFADQSHLTHRFKRLIGVTPGRYARERKIVQDGPPRGPYAAGEGAERRQEW